MDGDGIIIAIHLVGGLIVNVYIHVVVERNGISCVSRVSQVSRKRMKTPRERRTILESDSPVPRDLGREGRPAARFGLVRDGVSGPSRVRRVVAAETKRFPVADGVAREGGSRRVDHAGEGQDAAAVADQGDDLVGLARGVDVQLDETRLPVRYRVDLDGGRGGDGLEDAEGGAVGGEIFAVEVLVASGGGKV